MSETKATLQPSNAAGSLSLSMVHLFTRPTPLGDSVAQETSMDSNSNGAVLRKRSNSDLTRQIFSINTVA